MKPSIEAMQHELNTMTAMHPNLATKELARRFGLSTFREDGVQYLETDGCILKCEWGNRAHTFIRVVEADCPDEEREPEERRAAGPFERTRRSVYARGNRWQIENFNSTH